MKFKVFKVIENYEYKDCIGMIFVHNGKTFEFNVQDFGDCEENEFDVSLVRCEKDENGQLTWENGSWLIDARIDSSNEGGEEVSSIWEQHLLNLIKNSNDATEIAKLCPDHDMEFYEFEEDGEYYHGFECSTCGMLQTG